MRLLYDQELGVCGVTKLQGSLIAKGNIGGPMVNVAPPSKRCLLSFRLKTVR